MNNAFIELDRAEFKLAGFLNVFKNKAVELCNYLSYRVDTEPCNGNHTVVLKIDSESFYKTKYENLCSQMHIDIEDLATTFNFPESVIIEFNNYTWPYATMYVYYRNDESDKMEYCIGMPNNTNTLESMIEDIKDLWRI